MTRAERRRFCWHAYAGRAAFLVASAADALAAYHHRRAIALFYGVTLVIPMMREPPATQRG